MFLKFGVSLLVTVFCIPKTLSADTKSGYGPGGALTIDELLLKIHEKQNGVSLEHQLKDDSGLDYTIQEYDIIVPGRRRSKRALFDKERLRLWPGGIIPYEYSSKFPKNDTRWIKAFESAKQEYEEKTCLKIVPRTTERYYLNIVNAVGCASNVGRKVAGQNLFLLGPDGANDEDLMCWESGTIIHELMHAFGVGHEQGRGDRDEYVEILYENIRNCAENQKQFRSYDSWMDMGSPYDYRSIMHYGKTQGGKIERSFEAGEFVIKQKTTIRTLDLKYQETIGKAVTMSESDVKQLKWLYDAECAKAPYEVCEDRYVLLCLLFSGSCADEEDRDWMATNCASTCELCGQTQDLISDNTLPASTPPSESTAGKNTQAPFRVYTDLARTHADDSDDFCPNSADATTIRPRIAKRATTPSVAWCRVGSWYLGIAMILLAA